MFDFYTQSGKRDNFNRGERISYSGYLGDYKGASYQWVISQFGIPHADGRGTVHSSTGVASGSFVIPEGLDAGQVDFWIEFDNSPYPYDFTDSFNVR